MERPVKVFFLVAVCAAMARPFFAESTFHIDRLSSKQVAELFPKRARSRVMENWPLLRSAMKSFEMGDSKELVIYALATIRAETGTFSPAPEASSKYSKTIDKAGYAGIQDKGTERPFGNYDSTIRFDSSGKPIINKRLGNRLYTGKDEELMRSRHGDEPRPDYNDGERYRGRGFVQITGRYNYEQMQRQLKGHLSINLVDNPEAASDPDIAARIIACVISLHRAELESAMRQKQFTRARKIVNAAALNMGEFNAVANRFDPSFGK